MLFSTGTVGCRLSSSVLCRLGFVVFLVHASEFDFESQTGTVGLASKKNPQDVKRP
jgi:hypothetical protein